MQGISIFYLNQFNQPYPLDSNIICKPNYKILIQNSLIKSSVVNIQLYNPFNYLINQFFVTNSSPNSISFHFNEFLPSGRYVIKLLLISEDQLGENTQSKSIEYYSFQFSGAYSTFNWILTYAINCLAKHGMDLRLAAPKQYFPFFLVESLEGRPTNTITTDVWSNWLLYNTSDKMGTNSIMFGYQSVIHTNYMVFDHNSLSKVITTEDPSLVNYLTSEPGIETIDELVKDFAKPLTAKTVFGIIHQILYLITDKINFKEQPGEFGAKYAILNRQGDCTEYSALFTAICRINKIPSRLVAGLKLIKFRDQSNWIRHAWSEIFYEGLWIPIDIVEGKGKIIGFHPELIPLFKGNWMAENMNREIKISILDEFKNELSTTDLINAYSSLSISFKVQQQKNGTDAVNSPLKMETTLISDIHVDNQVKINSEINLTIEFAQLKKYNVIGIYYKAKTSEKIKSPKIVTYIEQLKENVTDGLDFRIQSPESPGNYELGVFVTSQYGELLGLFSTMFEIIL